MSNPDAPVSVGRLESLRSKTQRVAHPHLQRARDGLIGQFWLRLLELEFIEKSIALAAKLFVSFFPVLIMAATLTPRAVRESIVSSLTSRFGLESDQISVVEGAFSISDHASPASSWIGFVVLVLYATSFTTALQRVYLRAWRRPRGGGVRNHGRGLTWILGVIVLIVAIGGLRRALDDSSGYIAVAVLAPIGAICLWWWTQHTMLRGEVRWRPLLPTAIITGLGATMYSYAASIWMPRVVASQVERFGFFGVSLAIVTWLVGLSFLIVGAAAAGPVLADTRSALGAWMRADGTEAPGILTPGAPEPLPAATLPTGFLSRLDSAVGQDNRDTQPPGEVVRE